MVKSSFPTAHLTAVTEGLEKRIGKVLTSEIWDEINLSLVGLPKILGLDTNPVVFTFKANEGTDKDLYICGENRTGPKFNMRGGIDSYQQQIGRAAIDDVLAGPFTFVFSEQRHILRVQRHVLIERVINYLGNYGDFRDNVAYQKLTWDLKHNFREVYTNGENIDCKRNHEPWQGEKVVPQCADSHDFDQCRYFVALASGWLNCYPPDTFPEVKPSEDDFKATCEFYGIPYDGFKEELLSGHEPVLLEPLVKGGFKIVKDFAEILEHAYQDAVKLAQMKLVEKTKGIAYMKRYMEENFCCLQIPGMRAPNDLDCITKYSIWQIFQQGKLCEYLSESPFVNRTLKG